MRTVVVLAAVMGFLGVGLGAFGAHALRQRLGEERLKTYQTGIQYHLIHALAMLLTGVLAGMGSSGRGWYETAGWLFFVGIVLFSGSLYLLALERLERKWGLLTPLGGLFFLSGWAAVAIRMGMSAH
ncbi:MAG: DUF423 domain-containing protein [Firmicutes bacterium]|nr:DUF423 domain-containing protein [Bacillota bacterium]